MNIPNIQDLDLIRQQLERMAKGKIFWQDFDLQQTFWVGVMEAIPKAIKNGTEIDYLFLQGVNSVRDFMKATWSRYKERYCVKCGRRFGYRTKLVKCRCGSELSVRNRFFQINDRDAFQVYDETTRIAIDQYVVTLSGVKRHIAQRWLIDQYEILYNNHLKKIGLELGISAPAVSRWKKIIREEIRVWLD